ncbi:protein HEATR9 [Suncus etruscus]|uniref:protein HEATR9 n=1 Tax=Suncus etruscus TaxID=109475 RepID=UPI002110D46B|nr:protein HEATR9 [Suncus etruscus]
MVPETRAETFDFPRLMNKCLWLDYPERNEEFRKAMLPVHLPVFHYQRTMEKLPPSPGRWRQHPNKPGAVPYCYAQKPESCMHWFNWYSEDKEASRVLWKTRDHPRSKPILHFRVSSTEDPLKQKRLKELTQSLTSPLEEEQHYAAQALGCLGIRDQFIMEALLWAAHNSPERVRYEACRSLAILGCLNEIVIHTLIKQLKGQNEARRLDTLRGLRIALNFWSAAPQNKKCQVWNEGKLVSVLQKLVKLVKKCSDEEAMEAALCLGFLRPCSNLAQEFLLQCLHQESNTKMKALQMLVLILKVKSEIVIMAILDQMNHSVFLEHRIEAARLLKIIGLEQIQAQGLEKLTFNLLMKKTHSEPFLVMRQTAAETAEELKMRPAMLNLVELQLQSKNPIVRQEAIISLGVLGIRSQHVFYLLLDLLDLETNQAVRKHLQKTLILLASVDPWVQNKLKNKVYLECEVTPKAETYTQSRRHKILDETKLLEDSIIIKLKHAKLSPFFIAKSSVTAEEQKRLSTQKESNFDLSTFSSNDFMPAKHRASKPESQGPTNSSETLLNFQKD